MDLASVLGYYILLGRIVGLVASLIVPGYDSIGLIGTLVIGVMGPSSAGGWRARCSPRPRAWTDRVDPGRRGIGAAARGLGAAG